MPSVKLEDLPVIMEADTARGTGTSWQGMQVGHFQIKSGTDITEALKGLPDDMCPCPHWGLVLKGAIHLRYADGTTEVIVTSISIPRTENPGQKETSPG